MATSFTAFYLKHTHFLNIHQIITLGIDYFLHIKFIFIKKISLIKACCQSHHKKSKPPESVWMLAFLVIC
ncbi:hypothetical protein FJO98_00625 [Enterococcus sp. PF-2]|nr:hypothetical protein CO692_10020 [Enterococcus sp. FDAARGOS_375]AUJ84302.1 hypothetical protein CXM95_02115 [Enterococcus sp. CR-Ec1]AVC42215.1 hypothetical protein AL523_18025 [Enterococcus gallinarum]AYJ43898.1 hypothetical protein D8N35_01830 [Enterococcus casseliflavus]MIM11610.1 hypothetical protein [Listeria monocytogenes]TPE08201.1 hypothetical protein FJP08_00625 [Enterococcus sp. PF-3]TPE29292.1 hypothetical protein FJO98_00625 [Enterococcus sp. PF-2]